MTVEGPVKPREVSKEYEENKTISPDEIGKLREWLRRQPHLPHDVTDLQLILVYHSCLNSMELAKTTLDLHFTLRTVYSFFQNRDTDKRMLDAADTVLLTPLAKTNSSGFKALYTGLLTPDPQKFNYPDVLRNLMMIVDLWQLEDGTWPGLIILIDMHQASPGHLTRLDLISIKQTLYFLQEAMLVRLKGVHFLNAPGFMDKLMMLLRPFMEKELLDMLYVHQIGSKTLQEHFPMDALPSDAGGAYKNKLELKEMIVKKLLANQEWFKQENKLRVDESKRPGKKTDLSGVGGIQGNFKKLDLD